MSRDDLIRAICESKKTYADWRLAKSIARDVSRRRKRRYEPYRCPICRRIHVGRARSNDDIKRFKQHRKEIEDDELRR